MTDIQSYLNDFMFQDGDIFASPSDVEIFEVRREVAGMFLCLDIFNSHVTPENNRSTFHYYTMSQLQERIRKLKMRCVFTSTFVKHTADNVAITEDLNIWNVFFENGVYTPKKVKVGSLDHVRYAFFSSSKAWFSATEMNDKRAALIDTPTYEEDEPCQTELQ